MGSSSGRKATRSGDVTRLLLPSNCSGADAASGRGVCIRTIRTDTWILRETERVGQIHAQCPLSRIFKRYFRPTINLLTWLSVVTALLANAIAAARGEAALKKTELAACAGRLVLRQRAVAYAAIGTTMPSCGVDKKCHARVPSVVAC